MRKIGILFLIIGLFCCTNSLLAQASASNDLLQISVNSGKGGNGGGVNLSTSLQILALFTVLSLAPAILVMTTSFLRIVIVFSFLRTSLTLQQPSNQIIISLALFLTAFIMAPVFEAINRDALQPARDGKITTEVAFEKATVPLRDFMLRQMKEKDLELFTSLYAGKIQFTSPDQLPLYVIIPSFMLEELRTSFQMGLLIMLPFLVIDLIVSSILMTLGMMMLPPTTISLPIKIMVFVLVDGWTLIVRSLVSSFSV